MRLSFLSILSLVVTSFILSAAESEVTRLEELRNAVEHNPNNVEVLKATVDSLVKLRSESSDPLIKLRTYYWQFWATKDQLHQQPTSTDLKNELTKLYKEAETALPAFKNDSRMVELGFLSHQDMVTGDPEAEYQYTIQYLKERSSNTVYRHGSEVDTDGIYAHIQTVLFNYEYRKICDQETKQVRELFAQGKSQDEIRVIRLGSHEKDYQANLNVRKTLDSFKAPPDAMRWSKMDLENDAKLVSPEFIEKTKASTPVVVAPPPESVGVQPPASPKPQLQPIVQNHEQSNNRPGHKIDILVGIASVVVALVLLFIFAYHRKSQKR